MLTDNQQNLQINLDNNLDKRYTIEVKIAENAPFPPEKPVYHLLTPITERGFSFSPRELLHAIGTKCAPLPASPADQSIIYALIHMAMLDLTHDELTIRQLFYSDLQANRSEEFGIGMTCLIAQKIIGIPLIHIEPIPGPGTRFDFRGSNGRLNCMFESRGTSYKSNQNFQINGGIEKKRTVHNAGNCFFDLELVISTFIGYQGTRPRIIIGDPDWSKFKSVFEKTDNRYYRLRHYCRVLQFIGLPDSAYRLYQYSKQYLTEKKRLKKVIWDEKQQRGYLDSISIKGDEFLGRWFNSGIPAESKKHEKMKYLLDGYSSPSYFSNVRVFQGIRRDIFKSGLEPEPFTQDILDKNEIDKYKRFNHSGVSVFEDGSLMLFECGEKNEIRRK